MAGINDRYPDKCRQNCFLAVTIANPEMVYALCAEVLIMAQDSVDFTLLPTPAQPGSQPSQNNAQYPRQRTRWFG